MLEIQKLRCEYKENPMGIDVPVPRLSWQLRSDKKGVMQTAYHIQVSKGDDSFSSLVWDTGIVESDQSIHIEYGGSTVESCSRYYYRVRVRDNKGNDSGWSQTAYWEMGLMNSGEWEAHWITPDIASNSIQSGPCPMIRNTFTVKGQVKTARVYATALGLYELHINGSRIGDELLTPGWTSYHKRLQYQTYDITPHLREGENAIGAILGDGWYRGYLTWENKRSLYGDKLAALIQICIEYIGGRAETVISDSNWKSSTGPILLSDIYHGETYDARLEKAGWSTPDYNDLDWHPVSLLDHTKEILVAQENVPVKVIDQIQPLEIFTTPAGDTVIDMGQNMVGWVRFKVTGESGTTITLQHAEVLDKDGNFYTDNLRSAKQTIQYILKGTGEEIFEPHFTFQGFRYVKLEGFTNLPSLKDFTGIVIHSDMEPTGGFECSDPLVNQLQHNILWGQKGNFVDVPTDCPQRDERLGWTGDAQVFIRTASYNMNVAPFFTKWLKDLQLDQTDEYGVPHVIPNVLKPESGASSAWADAATICPWTLYLCYGDNRILETQYESMKRWVEYVRRQGDNEYLWNTGFHFGDWLGLDAKENSYVGATATDYIATAFYAYSTSLLVKAAEVLHRNEDRKRYSELYDQIVENFQKEFVTPNGRLAVPTQTACALALMFDLVDARDRKRVADTLAQYLHESKDHLTTGFVGTPYLCQVLSENGHNDLAYKLLLQKDYPSWLYSITKGATTIWEHWDGIKEDGSFWSRDMNSFNHYAYGSIGDWLYRFVAGIDTDSDKTGYKHIHIRPQPGPGLSYVKAKLQSMYGEIASEWRETDNGMEVCVTIPPNTTATVVLPLASLETHQEKGHDINLAEGITGFEKTVEGVKVELGSGEYRFTYKIIKAS